MTTAGEAAYNAQPEKAPHPAGENRAPGPKFVEEVLQALIELDAEHLEALAAAAERFRKDSALRLSPDEVAEMEAKMRLFAAILQETRKNLRILGLSLGNSGPYGYRPGRELWAD